MHSEQPQNLERVNSKIGPTVVEFVQEHSGMMFHADQLRAYVYARCKVAPASPDRILRNCRQKGLIDYRVIDRRNSLYLATVRHPATPF